jgi:hypothetical protein
VIAKESYIIYHSYFENVSREKRAKVRRRGEERGEGEKYTPINPMVTSPYNKSPKNRNLFCHILCHTSKIGNLR